MAKRTQKLEKDLNVPEFKLSQIDDIHWERIPKIDSSRTAVELLSIYIGQKELGNQINVNEFAFVIYTNQRLKVLGITNLAIGGIDGTVLDVRLIFAQAVLLGATGIIVAHNHPTGNLFPSDADKRMAKQLKEGSRLLSIKLLDFMIITSNSGYYSFVDQNEESMYAKGGEIAHPRINWSEYYEHGGSISNMPPTDENGERKIDDESIKELTEYVTSLPQTKAMYFNEATGQYSPERKELHAEIINSYKDDVVCITEGKPIAILMGGSPASGKSSFLRKYSPYLLQDEILRVDADDIRAKLPEYNGYNATQTHLETKDIVNTLISDRVIGIPCDFDLIYDGTMNSVRSYLPLIDTLKKRNYLIFIVYMDNVPKDVIIDRILKRYQKTGRFVPLEVVEDFYQKGRVAFDQLKNKVDGYMVIDGNSFDYPIIEQGGMELPQERAYSMLGYPIPKETLPKEYAKGGKMAEGGEVSEWKKAATIKRATKQEAEKNKNLLIEYYGKAGRNFKVEKRDNGWVVTYEFSLTDKMAKGGELYGTLNVRVGDEFATLLPDNPKGGELVYGLLVDEYENESKRNKPNRYRVVDLKDQKKYIVNPYRGDKYLALGNGEHKLVIEIPTNGRTLLKDLIYDDLSSRGNELMFDYGIRAKEELPPDFSTSGDKTYFVVTGGLSRLYDYATSQLPSVLVSRGSKLYSEPTKYKYSIIWQTEEFKDFRKYSSSEPTTLQSTYVQLYIGEGVIDAKPTKTTKSRSSRYFADGGYMAKGGVTGYERLVKKVAANYEGKAVPSRYQSKYGKRYDADEAKKVGYAVATKVYGKPMARMAEGGGIGGTIKGLNADEFAYLYIKRGIKSPFREEYLKPIGLWKTAKAQEIEKSLIAKGLLNSAGAITEAGKTLAKQIDTEIQSAFSGGYIGSMTSSRVDKFNNVKEKFASYAKGGEIDDLITAEDRMIARQHTIELPL